MKRKNIFIATEWQQYEGTYFHSVHGTLEGAKAALVAEYPEVEEWIWEPTDFVKYAIEDRVSEINHFLSKDDHQIQAYTIGEYEVRR